MEMRRFLMLLPLLILLLMTPALLHAQINIGWANHIYSGAGAPPATLCVVFAHVGNVYYQNDALSPGASLFGCSQTSSGTYAWESLQSGGGGAGSFSSLDIVNAGIAGIIQFIGTDGSTHTDLSAKNSGVGLTATGPITGPTISPAQITAQQNDYAPTGYLTAATWYLTSDTSRSITGIQGGIDGRLVTLCNANASAANLISLVNASASSAAANRFNSLWGNLSLAGGVCVRLIYDGTNATVGWREANHVFQTVPMGGTGAATLTNHGVLVGGGTSAVGATAAGAAGQVLTGVASADPAWSYPFILSGNGGGANVSASTTSYVGFGTQANVSANSISKGIAIYYPCTLQNFRLTTSGSEGAGTGATLNVIVNTSTSTGITTTIASGAAAGTVSDLTHTYTISAGDYVSLQWVQGTGAGATIGPLSIECK